ncbi:MAG: type II toxin-antitoxin system HicB family antitoxin [Gemmatimonadaceae bacterium]
MDYKGYTAKVIFDGDAGVLFGEVEGLRDVVTFEATNVESLETAFRESVDDYLDMCVKRGEEPDKPYSGKILVRADSSLHRDLAQAAAREGLSLNAAAADAFRSWITQRHVAEPAATYGPPENAGPNERLPAAPVPHDPKSAIEVGTERVEERASNSSTPPRIDTPSMSDTSARAKSRAAHGKRGEDGQTSHDVIQQVAA